MIQLYKLSVVLFFFVIPVSVSGGLSIVTRYSGHCDFSNVVAFGHNELWQPSALNSLYVTSQIFWHLATTNCSSLWPWIASLWPIKCCGLCPQRSVAAIGLKMVQCNCLVNGQFMNLVVPKVSCNGGCDVSCCTKLFSGMHFYHSNTVTISGHEWPFCDSLNVDGVHCSQMPQHWRDYKEAI